MRSLSRANCRAIFAAVAVLWWLAAQPATLIAKDPVAGPVDLDKELLDKITKATVYVRVSFSDHGASGSGFLVKSNGDTAYIVTNYHVIAAEKKEEPKSAPKGRGPFGMPMMQMPRFPMMGRGPFGPQAPQQQQKEKASISVVLHSGTPQDQSLRAEVVATDEESDLAVLRVTGGRKLPDPIDISQEASVAETQPIYTFGFPMDKVEANPESPTISVGKGTISGLRRNENKELTDIHFNGELIQGNSGGPVIDDKGRLVGVAVATVRSKQIGFAVPAVQLTQMFKGRLSSAIVFQLKQQGTRLDAIGERWEHDRASNVHHRDTIEVRLPDVPGNRPPLPADEYNVMAILTDPMLKIDGITAYLAAKADFTSQAKGWAKLENSKPIPLKIQDQTATGTFKLPLGAEPDVTYAFQFSYVNADGKTIFTQPHPVRLTFPKNPKSVTLNITGIPSVATRRFIEDTSKKLFAGKTVTVKQKTRDSLVLEVDPVPDPKAIADQIDFGTVKEVKGRTFLIVGKSLELPLPDKAEVAEALEKLQSKNKGMHMAAVEQLGKFYRPLPEQRTEVAKALEPLTTDKDGWLCNAALRALGVWGGPDNIPAIAAAIDNWFTRGEARELLATFKDPRAAEAIAKMLPWLGDRAAACAILKEMGPLAEKSVIPFVTHKDGFTAIEAIKILQEIGTKECISVLMEVANGTNGFVNGHAREALKAVRARTESK